MQKASFAIRSIGRIRRYLLYDGLKMLVNSLVISRLDYCNSILWDTKVTKGQITENPEYRCLNDNGNTKHWPYNTYFKESALAASRSKN